MSTYSTKVKARDHRPPRDPLPPVGSQVMTGHGRRGKVVAHLLRTERSPLAEVQFEDRRGWYQVGELRIVREAP